MPSKTTPFLEDVAELGRLGADLEDAFAAFKKKAAEMAANDFGDSSFMSLPRYYSEVGEALKGLAEYVEQKPGEPNSELDIDQVMDELNDLVELIALAQRPRGEAFADA